MERLRRAMQRRMTSGKGEKDENIGASWISSETKPRVWHVTSILVFV